MKLAAKGELYGRSIPEWIGKTPDTPVPKEVQLRVFLRQDGRCAITGSKIRDGDKTHCDHIKRLKDGGENRESNLQIILDVKHIEKTARENSIEKKIRKLRLQQAGLWPKSRRPLRSRGFDKSRELDPDT